MQEHEVAQRYRWFAYVNWPEVPQYTALGWLESTSAVPYPRLAAYGTTMEWHGAGKPLKPTAAAS